MTLLQCGHDPLFAHNCRHSEDAGVICRDEHRLASINATVTNQGTATVTTSIVWEIMNNTLDMPSFFEISCFNERHHTMVTENNETFITQLELGAHNRDRFSYNCCVSAVYSTLQPATPATKICTQLDLELYNSMSTGTPPNIPSSTIMSVQSPQKFSECNSSLPAGIVGGVLGCIITLLIILLGMALTCLLVQAKKSEIKHPAAPLRYWN